MPGLRDAARGPAVLTLLFVLILVTAGCDLVVEDPSGARNDDIQRSAMSTAVADLPDYDVEVTGIDFDPPLKRETLLSTQTGVKLLAAVENKGTMPLTRLVVVARVTSQKGDFSVHDQVPVARLSPGETKVVEFASVAPVDTVPRSPSYQVTVTVSSQSQNVSLQSASRSVIVRVVDSGSQDQ